MAASGISGKRTPFAWRALRRSGSLSDKLRVELFDTAHYLASNPDVRRSGADPYQHYITHGWREGRWPCSWFDPQFYLEAYPDVRASGTEPLLHFIAHGAKEGRQPNAGSASGRPPSSRHPPVVRKISASDREAAMRHFDRHYYLAVNPDVVAAGAEPFEHFLEYGWREGRNPSATFNVDYYLRSNPDVAASGQNPLVHFAVTGKAEGRVGLRPMNAWLTQLDMVFGEPAEPEREDDAPDEQLLSYAQIAAALPAGGASQGIVLALSHDDYAVNAGGIQNVIGDEQQAFETSGWCYLHVSPAVFLRGVMPSTGAASCLVQLRLNGNRLGRATVADLIEAVSHRRAEGLTFRCIVHHFMGFSPEHVLALVDKSGDRHPVVWVHDFFSICPSFTLMRNEVAFCGAPPVDSSACTICYKGADRMSYAERFRVFFDTVRPVVLAPSALALDLWRRRSQLRHEQGHVVSLARVRMAGVAARDEGTNAARPGRPLRIAHLGSRGFHKGWPVFEQLALRFASDERYSFHHLGLDQDQPLIPNHIVHVPVRVNGRDRNAMVEAIVEAQIDVVILWSLWPETFSYTAHEAIAGGAFAVVRKAAGNMWPVIEAAAPDRGCAVETEDELIALLDSNVLQERVASLPRVRGDLVFSSGTADWLLRRSAAAE